MFLFNNIKMDSEKIQGFLADFESFCMGEKNLSPEQFKSLNIELSINAALHVGKHKFKRRADGQHLIWTGLDKREHDLGCIDTMNVVRDYPGFNKMRSLSLGHDDVEAHRVFHAPFSRKPLSIVKMKDGSTGIGPNYKTALRNAALKMQLKRQFNLQNTDDLWKRFYGNS